MTKAETHDPWQGPVLRQYWLLCLGALLVLTLALVLRSLEVWALLPILVGSLSLAFRWRSGPVLALVALGWVLYSERLGLSPMDLVERVLFVLVNAVSIRRAPLPPARLAYGLGGRFQFSDVILCGAALVYGAAHYRLVGLGIQLFPRDPRRQGGRPAGWAHPHGVRPRRSEAAVGPHELLLLGASVPGWVGLAAVVWSWLMERRAPVLEWPSPFWQAIYPELAQRGSRLFIDLPAPVWRAMLLAWGLGVVLIVGGGLIHYLGWRRMSPPEAALFLQDTLWRETCREQRLVGRWLARMRLRRRKEKR